MIDKKIIANIRIQLLSTDENNGWTLIRDIGDMGYYEKVTKSNFPLDFLLNGKKK